MNKVHEPSIIHDVLWQFNCALASHPVQQIAAKVKAEREKDDKEQRNDKVCAGLRWTGLGPLKFQIEYLVHRLWMWKSSS